MTIKYINSVSKILGAAALMAVTLGSQQAFGETNRLCANGEPSNCFLTGNFPPEVLNGLSLGEDEELSIRFYNGEWSIGGVTIGMFGATGWTPTVGDWDNDGYDNVGVYKDGLFIHKTSWNFPAVDYDVEMRFYGDATWTPITGDWNADGTDSIGLYKDGEYKLRLDSDDASSEVIIDFGDLPNPANDLSGALPVAGALYDGVAGDRVGVLDGTSMRAADENVSAYYPPGAIQSVGVSYRGIPTQLIAERPIVIKDGSRDELVFAAPPKAGNVNRCPDVEHCRWINRIEKPNEAGREDIPNPMF